MLSHLTSKKSVVKKKLTKGHVKIVNERNLIKMNVLNQLVQKSLLGQIG